MSESREWDILPDGDMILEHDWIRHWIQNWIPVPDDFVGKIIGKDIKGVSGKIRRHRESTVDHPTHYNSHPSGIECIQITEHMGFCLGNVMKYIWRADLKGGVEDLEKARWYIEREIEKRRKGIRG